MGFLARHFKVHGRAEGDGARKHVTGLPQIFDAQVAIVINLKWVLLDWGQLFLSSLQSCKYIFITDCTPSASGPSISAVGPPDSQKMSMEDKGTEETKASGGGRPKGKMNYQGGAAHEVHSVLECLVTIIWMNLFPIVCNFNCHYEDPEDPLTSYEKCFEYDNDM